MAQITRYPFIRHLRAEASQYILHYGEGRVALQSLAERLQSIQHLNVTPDLLGAAFQQFLRDDGARGS